MTSTLLFFQLEAEVIHIFILFTTDNFYIFSFSVALLFLEPFPPGSTQWPLLPRCAEGSQSHSPPVVPAPVCPNEISAVLALWDSEKALAEGFLLQVVSLFFTQMCDYYIVCVGKAEATVEEPS